MPARVRWAALLLLFCLPVRAQGTPASAPAANQAASAGAAAPSPTAPVSDSEAARTAAREAYARGQALFAEGKYAEAKAEFEQAHQRVANPVVLLSMAECEIRLEQIEQAHGRLQEYLAARPDAPDRAEVEAKVVELSARRALLQLTSEPRRVAIQLDGAPVDTQTPAELYISPGAHLVTLSQPGYEPVTETVHATMGGHHTLRLVLRPIPVVAAPPPAPVAPASNGMGAAVWTTAIVGGVGLATGAVLGILALDERNHFDHMPSDASADRGERLALFADVAFAVGAVSLITTAVLCVTRGGVETDRPDAALSAVQMTPLVFRDGAGFAATSRF